MSSAQSRLKRLASLSQKAVMKFSRLRAKSMLAWVGTVAGRFRGATIFTPFTTTVSPSFDSVQLPPPSAPRSMITEPGFMLVTMASSSSFGAKTPPMRAVVMTTSTVAQCSASILACRALSSADSSAA